MSLPARYLVVGCPVEHSLSPAMMTAAFAAAGIPATYEALEIAPAEWSTAMTTLHRDGLAGANVTVPHKEAALAGAASASAVARAIGAANTLTRREDGWEGDNTDGPGFLDWVESHGASALLEREALVLGAGGSARAVVWALLTAGCPHVRLANRTEARARKLVAEMEPAAAAGSAGSAGSRNVRITCEAPGGVAPKGGLVVNCTSLGLKPADPSPIASDDLKPAALFLDLVYGDPPGVRVARAGGVAADAGLGLLVAQGARSFEMWTGSAPDRDVMRRAAEREAARRRTES